MNLHKKESIYYLNSSRVIDISKIYIYAFCNLTNIPTDKILLEQMLIKH